MIPFEKICHDAGILAAEKNQARIPNACMTFLGIIAALRSTLPVVYSKPLAEAWIAGYDCAKGNPNE